MSYPTRLAINAWTIEGPATGDIGQEAKSWILNTIPPEVKDYLIAPDDPDEVDWRNPSVGWGLVLPTRDDLSVKQLAFAYDAPQPIQDLLEARKKILQERGGDAPIFRYIRDSPDNITHLRNYASELDKAIHPSTEQGTSPTALPKYLLIYGTPEEIPWELQYSLNATCFVGRLDLQGAALENYVNALLNDWKNSSLQWDHPVVWAVKHDADFMTSLMRDAIAMKVYEDLDKDEHLHGKVLFIDGSTDQASSEALINALIERKPSLIVTTSHGKAEPLSDPTALKREIGFLIDQDFETVQPERLLQNWEPDGAIWYAHACYSAGSDSSTIYDGLLDPDSEISQVLTSVAKVGALIAPLPKALLGATKPLRAFVGHVEPTFDMTLRHPSSSEHLTYSLRRALYNKLFGRKAIPVGLAFAECYKALAALNVMRSTAFRRFGQGEDTTEVMLYCNLTSLDLQSIVILGDPTVSLPKLI